MRVIVRFIDDNRQEFGARPVVRVLNDTPARIATSSYYAYKKRPPSDRERRDERLKVVIWQIFDDNYQVYGARKIWHVLNREHTGEFGHVARCTVERLMKQMGIRGLNRRRKRPSTKSAAAEECPDDQVKRDSRRACPKLSLGGRYHIHSHRCGVGVRGVHPGCVLPRDCRLAGHQPPARIVSDRRVEDGAGSPLPGRGGHPPDSSTTPTAEREYRAIRYGETLGESKAVASVGSKGDSFDNAMDEALNSNYKGELIDRRSWSGLIDVTVETARWIGWYNHSRLHSAIDYRPPREVHNEAVTRGLLRADAA